MMIIEMREAAYDKAFELLDEAKEHSKEQKLVLCKLEDALYECYEASKDAHDEEDDEYYSPEEDKEEYDMNYRRRYGMRRNMRMRNYDDNEELYSKSIKPNRHSGYRRMRSGRYSY